MRFALVVRPKNYLLFACHFTNVIAQFNLLQRRVLYEYDNYKLGLPLDHVDPALTADLEKEPVKTQSKSVAVLDKIEDKASSVVDRVKADAAQVAGKSQQIAGDARKEIELTGKAIEETVKEVTNK